MTNEALVAAFRSLATPPVADAVMRAGAAARQGPPDLRPLADCRLSGRAVPVRHHGSVDVFLEAIGAASPGDVLVIDNAGRDDEACIGDMLLREARAFDLAGVVVWGKHRDTDELLEIGLPVFSTGALPFGPRRLDAREPETMRSARIGDHVVTRADIVFGDADGLVFVPATVVEEVLATAASIHETEREQAAAIAGGTTLSEQLHFADYLAQRERDPAFTFRQHLRAVGGEVEE